MHVGDFVGIQASEEVQRNGEVFWVAKVQKVKNMVQEDGEFLVLWNWPTAPRGLRDDLDVMRNYYSNSLAQTWEPNRTYKRKDCIPMDSEFILWVHCAKSKFKMITIQEHRIEKKITIPTEQHLYFQHLSCQVDLYFMIMVSMHSID